VGRGVLVEDEVEQVEYAAHRNVLHVVVQDVEHLTLDLVRLVDVLLETQAVVEELGERVGTEWEKNYLEDFLKTVSERMI
jgi:hypothetical protein